MLEGLKPVRRGGELARWQLVVQAKRRVLAAGETRDDARAER